MKTAGIHFQFGTENLNALEQLLSADKPFLAFIVPNLLDKTMTFENGGKIFKRLHPKNNYYTEQFKNRLTENGDNPNITWVQEGYRHCCERCFENGKDPYHEHVCLDGVAQNIEKQNQVIVKGNRLMQNELGIRPTAYCPPNHMFNQDTLTIAPLQQYQYFIIKNAFDYFGGIVDLSAYKENGLTIVPESKFKQAQNSPIIATYYDYLVDQGVKSFSRILNQSEPLSNLSLNKKPKTKIWLNNKLLIAAKKLRDFKKKS